MKALNLTVLLLFISLQCYGQLHTFKADDPVSAKEMNENFQHLEKQFRGTKSIDIDCDNGGSISAAIANGFNDITVLGTCSENLRYTVWRDDSVDAYVPSGKFAPRFLKITGANQTAKIKDASSNSESLIYAAGGLTIFLKDITLEGGRRGVVGKRNSNLLLSNVTVGSFRDRGVDVQDSSYLGIDEGGVKIIGTNSTETDRGLNLGTGSTGWVSKVNISNVKRGITLYSGSFLTISEYTITASKRGIEIQDSGFDDSSSSDSSIEGSNEFALKVSNGSFYNRKGKLEIKNLNGGRAINFEQSNGSIRNLKITDFEKIGENYVNLILVDSGSVLLMGDSEVTGNFDRLLQLEGGSSASLLQVKFTGESVDKLIAASNGSNLGIFNNSILNVLSGKTSVDIWGNSRLKMDNSTISGSLTDRLLALDQGSTSEIRDSTITCISCEKAIDVLKDSSLNLYDVDVLSANKGITVQKNSYLEMSSGSSVSSENEPAIAVSLGSGVDIRGSTVTSTGKQAINIYFSSWASIVDENSNINRIDPGADIVISEGILRFADTTTIVDEISCSSRGFVSGAEGRVNNLGDGC